MRHKIILWYNKNKQMIWKIIVIMIISIFLIRSMVHILKKNMEQEQTDIIKSQKNTDVELNSVTLDENRSTVSGKSMTKTQINGVTKIDEFINCCNNNKINEAYELLSEDCKSEMYPTIDEFKKYYYDKIFNGKKKNISVENWVGYIYKVKYNDDALSTGVYNTDNTIQDYISISKNTNDEMKLNINSYIGKQEINKQSSEKNVNIKVLEKYQYMDYEIYSFEVTNNSDIMILLNNNNNADAMYLRDENKIQYPAYTHEISEAELKIASGETKRIRIKYYNKYSSSRKIKSIVFSKIILNYYAYINYQNVGYYKNYGIIEIDI